MIGMNHGRDDAGLIPRICGMVFNPEPRAQASRYPSGAHARAYDACVHACACAGAARVRLHARIAVSEIWLGVIDGQEARVSVTISVVEVYSENLFDLLAPPMLRNQPLKLKQVSVGLFNGWLGWMRTQYSTAGGRGIGQRHWPK